MRSTGSTDSTAQMSCDKVAANVFWRHGLTACFGFVLRVTVSVLQTFCSSLTGSPKTTLFKRSYLKSWSTHFSNIFSFSKAIVQIFWSALKGSELACLDGFYVVQGGRGGSDSVILKIWGCMYVCLWICSYVCMFMSMWECLYVQYSYVCVCVWIYSLYV